MRSVFPHGVDFFSDGVGGALTHTVVKQMKENGRVFAYGSAATYYWDEPVPVPNPFIPLRFFGITEELEAVLKRKNVRVEAWLVDAFYHDRQRAEDDLSRLLLAGKIRPIFNVVEGFEQLPLAIVDLYRKPRQGKLQVRFDR